MRTGGGRTQVRVHIDVPDAWIYRVQEKLRTRGPEDTVRAALRYVLGYEVFGWQNALADIPEEERVEGAAAIETIRHEELGESRL